jgi:O-antigen biosynthesis protein
VATEHVRLVALRDLEVTHRGYRSTGRDPQLGIEARDGRPLRGYCIVRYAGSTEFGRLAPVLYAADRAGHRPQLTFVLPPSSGELVQHWVRLPDDTRALRLDPMDRPGAFTLNQFDVEPIPRWKARLELATPFFRRGFKDPAMLARYLRTASILFRRNGPWGIEQGMLEQQHYASDYDSWIEQYDTLSQADRDVLRARADALPHKPLISVVMPVFNPRPEHLDAAIASVRAQLYSNWELCIADDASTNAGVHRVLQRHAREEPRIRVVYRSVNGHISAASNSALELARGEWVALLDHDDVVREHALSMLAQAIVERPGAQLVYSDEDKLDARGRRYDHYFKPDWNPDLFLSHNFLAHLVAWRTERVRAAGGFRVGFEGAQDYDLALRLSAELTPEQIVHIPRVLYHWRSGRGSTALGGSEKPYAQVAGVRALTEHFIRHGETAKVEALPNGGYRVRYLLPDPVPLVTIIIPTRNGLSLLRRCIETLREKTRYAAYELLVVDNGSDDPATLEYLASLEREGSAQILRRPEPFNFSRLNNAAVREARGEFVCLLNNDIEVGDPNWLRELVSHACRSGVGCVGARLWFPDGRLQHGGVFTGVGGVAGHAHKYLRRGDHGYMMRAEVTQTMSAVTAACLVVRRSTYLQVGGLDEEHLPVNDVDLCLRVREAGYRNVWTPFAELVHHESATRGVDATPEEQARSASEQSYMHARWAATLRNDPAYNPNLTLACEDLTLAVPPRVAPLTAGRRES